MLHTQRWKKHVPDCSGRLVNLAGEHGQGHPAEIMDPELCNASTISKKNTHRRHETRSIQDKRRSRHRSSKTQTTNNEHRNRPAKQ